MDSPGFLGTAAPLSRDITLLLYILLLAPAMIIGFIFARRKMFAPYHKFTMTGITIFNWILIIIIMVVSYRFMTTDTDGLSLSTPVELLATLHLITGAAAQLLATYLVIMMWTERTSLEKLVPFRFKNIKRPMRLTLALWLTTVVLGIGIYLMWYVVPSGGGGDTPAVTEEAPDAISTESANPAATEASSSGSGGAPAITESADPAATEDADDDD
jgi:uncharacterized membrane protein YozB (DUF420 family)